MATSNMGLTLPDVSVTPGPTWASQINSDLTLIDQHNHTLGFGARIPTAGLNINAELKFNETTPNGLPATGLSRLGLLSPQTPPVATGVYSDASGDLYYDNAAGDSVQITDGASVKGSGGTITGMVGTQASASYNNGTGTYTWQKDAGLSQAATMDSGPLKVRDGTTGANAITITPPSGLASAYTLTLPASAPSGQRLMTANAGVSSFATVNSTLTLTSSLLKVADLGVDTAQLANGSVTTDKIGPLQVTTIKIADGTVTQAKWGAKSILKSVEVASASTNSTTPVAVSSGGNYLTVTTSLRAGHTMMVCVQPAGNATFSNIGASGSSTNTLTFEIDVMSPSGTITYPIVAVTSWNGAHSYMPVNSISFLYLPSQNGSHTFTVMWSVSNASLTGTIAGAQLAVYEA